MSRLRVSVVALLCLFSVAAVYGQTPSPRKRAAVGKLGQLNQAANIYLKPDKRARILYKGQSKLYVVLRSLTDSWATIVMADNSSGYVETKYVDRLPYEVNVRTDENYSAARRDAVQLNSRGDYERIGGAAGNIIRSSMQYIGTPYVWGGNSLTGGVDCSGYIQQLFRQQGLSLPRTAQEQSQVGMLITRIEDLVPGDRLYFTNSARQRVTHTGLYIGNNAFIHSSPGNRGVAIDPLSARWVKAMVAARR